MQILLSGVHSGLSFNLYLKITVKFSLRKINIVSIKHNF